MGDDSSEATPGNCVRPSGPKVEVPSDLSIAIGAGCEAVTGVSIDAFALSDTSDIPLSTSSGCSVVGRSVSRAKFLSVSTKCRDSIRNSVTLSNLRDGHLIRARTQAIQKTVRLSGSKHHNQHAVKLPYYQRLPSLGREL